MKQILKAHFLVLIATFLVAGSFIVSQKLSGIIDPISLTLLRFVLASFFLAPIIFLNKKYRDNIATTLPRAMIISLFYSLYFIGLFKALETTTALNTGTLFTLVPLFTALVCLFIFKDKMSMRQFVIYLIGMFGTGMVVFKGDLNLFLNFSLNQGDTIFLFAIIAMVFYSVSMKFLHRKTDELLVLVFCTLVGGCIWMFLSLLSFDIPLQWGKIQGDLIFYMLYLTIGATLFTVYLYQQAAIGIGPKKLMAYVYLNPVAIAFLLFIFEHQAIVFKVSVGIVISTITTFLLLI
ncbi:MAG: DMT family transporter [Candidatus Marinarcus sp.]|uniref:DMT family transporter n=1 Tax=Candidatus Marinarcus sp. TaxID=3100987 RepID=UPI003AFF97DA